MNNDFEYLDSLNDGEYVYTLFNAPAYSRSYPFKNCGYCHCEIDASESVFALEADRELYNEIVTVKSSVFFICNTCMSTGVALEECMAMIDVKSRKPEVVI
ncbi:MAG: hypothetical protein L3J75_08165 [Methylococcaceae bacterium]|nr:hypothetical protein [Methylococcaceae bacterium]